MDSMITARSQTMLLCSPAETALLMGAPVHQREQQTHAQKVRTVFFLCCSCSSFLLIFLGSALRSCPSIATTSAPTNFLPDYKSPSPPNQPRAILWQIRTQQQQQQQNSTAPSMELLPDGEQYMWYSPHEGFSNQAVELANALKIALLLNRTLIVPPMLEHFEVAAGKCLAQVFDPPQLRRRVWAAITKRLQPAAADPPSYVSIADIIDLSSIQSIVKTIDLRVFLALWCGIDFSSTCSGTICHRLAGSPQLHPWGNLADCAAKLFPDPSYGTTPPVLKTSAANLVHEVDDNCRTTVWTYRESLSDQAHREQHLTEVLQNDPSLNNATSLRSQRRDVVKTLGPGSTPGTAFLLSFGSLFSRNYEEANMKLMVDITAPLDEHRIAAGLRAIGRLPFTMDILDAGRLFAKERIQEPFFCAHVRVNDGYFKENSESRVFKPLIERLDSLGEGRLQVAEPMNMFLMTDLPQEHWPGTYLQDLSVNPMYKIHTIHDGDNLLTNVMTEISFQERGLLSGFLPQHQRSTISKEGQAERIHQKQDTRHLDSAEWRSFDLSVLRLFIEEVVCSCASLGFHGTYRSTIDRNIRALKEQNLCHFSFGPQMLESQ